MVLWLEQDPPPVNVVGARHWNWVHAGAGPLRTPRRVKAGSDASRPAVVSETSFVSRRPGRRYMLVQLRKSVRRKVLSSATVYSPPTLYRKYLVQYFISRTSCAVSFVGSFRLDVWRQSGKALLRQRGCIRKCERHTCIRGVDERRKTGR
jgi:hypothetical protein